MIKAAFFDIDGTLIDFGANQITDSTLQAFNLLKQRDIKIFIATGRTNTSLDVMKNVDFDGYVTSNGQYCYTKDELIYDQPIHPDDIRGLVQWMKNQKEQIPIIFNHEAGFFINSCNEEVLVSHKAVGIPIPPIMPVEEALQHKIYQISPYIPIEEEPEFLIHMPHSQSTRWTDLFADVIPKGGSKAVGIEKMLAHFEIPLEQSISFGDGGNDIEMLKYTAIGVAMGNASDNVKQHADYVTSSITEDGVYNALKHFDII